MLTARTLITCFLRTYLVGTGFNTRGLQNTGLVFAMEPGLREIYKTPERLREARNRYLELYNTHPFWTPLLVGVFLSLESHIARGQLPPKMLNTVKETTTYTLSAIGDSFFGGSLLATWALSTVCFLVAGLDSLALAWTLLLFTALQLFKFFTFAAGVRNGLTSITSLKNWDLINWGDKIKLANSVILVLMLYLFWPGTHTITEWTLIASLLLSASYLVGKLHLSRVFLVYLLLFLVFFVLPWISKVIPLSLI
ncbi:MAG: PTS system mannose/fructose/sorbose family transporter subunit IID [Desulfovibrionales bacterium]|nr:PTS system mannose/fructose/sorbose family transporter subunit IID [Desulfovibrionales bacterium]